MNVGSLFILFKIKTDDESFKDGLKQLAALRVASAGVTGLIRNVGGALVHMALKAAEAGTHILGTSSALGLSTKSFQEWSYIAKQAGSNADQFTVGISMFERNLREFAAGRGSRRFKDAMRDIGLTQQDAKQALIGPDGINGAIFKISDAYLKMGNTANRAAINTGLFGARARGMAQDLGQGSNALRTQIARLHEIGGVVDEDKLRNLKKFNNSVENVKTSLNGLAMQIVGQLAPKFTKMLDKMTRWIGKNKEMISGVLTVVFKVVAFAFEVIADVIKQIGDLIKGVMHGDTGAIVAFTLLASLVVTAAIAIASMLIPTIVAMGAALFEAMLPLLPWTLLLAGMIIVTVLLLKHWDQIHNALQAFGRAVKGIFNWIIGVLAKAGDGFAKLGHIIANGFMWAIRGVGDVVVRVVGFFVEKAINGVNLVIRALNKLPRVNIGQIEVPEWARHNTAEAPVGSDSSAAPGAHVPYAETKNARVRYEDTRGAHVAYADTKNAHVQYADIKRQPQGGSVSIAPTTVNIYGVKDADQAGKHISDAIDAQHRHAFAAVGGE